MLHRLKKQIGTAGLSLAIVALILAMAGGALAASGALTGKQKKEVEKIAKKFAGKAGPQGPAGPSGTKGDPGPEGREGSEGKPGKNGEKGTTGATGAAGTTGLTGATGATGATGEPWTAGGTLPPGATELGDWSFSASTPKIKVDVEGTTQEITINESGVKGAFAPISFPIRFPFNIKAAHVHYGEQETEPFKKTCPGTTFKPTAEPGELCVYQAAGGLIGTTFSGIYRSALLSGPGATQSGAYVGFNPNTGPASDWGSFAVTGCKEKAGTAECE
ncbi:MAG TPA: hypothetical protein VGH58_07505 [Solirubrobacterales bacterium]|jgi:hypothetical protein